MSTCIILDSNQWYRMPALRSPLAASLLFQLKNQTDAFIGVPEVIYLEVAQKLVEKHRQLDSDITKFLHVQKQILGKAPDPLHASDAEVRLALQDRLESLAPLVRKIDLTDSDYVIAGRLLLEYAAPNTRDKQQYRDSLIWSVVARMATEHDVILVSEDNDFRNAKGDELATSLQKQIDGLAGRVTLLRKVDDLLNSWSRTPKNVNQDLVASLLADAMRSQATSIVHGTELELAVGKLQNSEISIFLTEDHDKLSVSGSINYELLGDEDKVVGAVEVNLTATVRAQPVDLVSAEPEKIVVWVNTDYGIQPLTQAGFVNVRSSITQGPPRYTLRHHLEL